MKIKSFFHPVFAALFFLSGISSLVPVAFATVPPSLQFSATGTGDNVQVTVYGDPNASVLLSYAEAGSGSTIVSLGNTDGNGNFSEMVSSASYGLTSGTAVTAIIGGTSGPRSPTVAWPTVTSASTLTLSQTAVVVNAGSSANLSVTNNTSNALYISNNSNPSVANVSISGTQVTISGNTAGTTNVTLCTVGSSANCPFVYVTVLQSGSAALTLSSANPTVVSGQNLPVTISGGNGSYLVQNNSNPNTIQASISGSVLTLSTGVSTGSATITVCSTDLASCGTVTATAGDASAAAVSLSSVTPSVAVNQNATVYVYGPSGVSYYVSSNSNPSVVQANLSGTTLTLTGITQGSSNISVCASTGSCATLTATITPAVAAANLALSQSTLSLGVGQNATIPISGGNQPYSVTGGVSSVTTQSINGTSLSVYGVGPGTSTLWVCENTGGACVGLTVTVSGSPSTVVPVSAPAVSNTPAPVTTSVVASATTFTRYLAPGSQDSQVLALQRLLIAQGFPISSGATGYYGSQTVNAVVAFQKAHGISQLGVVGPATRTALNALEGANPSSGVSSSSTTAVANMTLAQLRAEAQTLESELAQVLSRITQLGG